MGNQYYTQFGIKFLDKMRRTNMKTIITSDSSCDLSKEQLETYNIKIIPIYVTMNGEEYKDGVNVSPFIVT